jgi:NTP pyrophosphatase (non-canonical NTP hydrolase)
MDCIAFFLDAEPNVLLKFIKQYLLIYPKITLIFQTLTGKSQMTNIQDKKESATMTINEYQKLAMTTLNPDLSQKEILINSVMGLCGESGEAVDLVKKHLFQGHELDKNKLAKELGDIAWYLAEAATALDIPLESVFQGNIDKLKKRYPEGFDFSKSLNRTEE